jgi:hypothetical protein
VGFFKVQTRFAARSRILYTAKSASRRSWCCRAGQLGDPDGVSMLPRSAPCSRYVQQTAAADIILCSSNDRKDPRTPAYARSPKPSGSASNGRRLAILSRPKRSASWGSDCESQYRVNAQTTNLCDPPLFLSHCGRFILRRLAAVAGAKFRWQHADGPRPRHELE